MKIWVSTDDKYPVYTVRGTEPDYKALEVEAETNPDVPMAFLEIDAPVDAETVARWETIQTEWLQMQAEIAALKRQP